jgi:hypothetical protein
MKTRPKLGEYLKSVARKRRPADACLDEQQVVEFYSGVLGDEEAERVRNHLADCPKCLDLAREARQFVEMMSGPVDLTSTHTVVEGAIHPPVAFRPSPRQSKWEALRAYLSVSPVFAFAVVAAVIIVAGSALLITQIFRLQDRILSMQAEQNEKERQVQLLEQELARERTRIEQLTAELQGKTSAPGGGQPNQAVDPRQPDKIGGDPGRDATAIASFVLTSSLVRDPGQKKPFELPATATQVELQVTLGADDYGSYRAVLRTADGEQKLSKSGLKAQATPSGKRLVIAIPANILDKRDYVLRLTGITRNGGQEELDQYPFSIIRK